MNSLQHFMRDSFGQAFVERVGLSAGIDKSWFFAHKRATRKGEMRSHASAMHVSLSFDLSLSDAFNNLGGEGRRKFYRLIVRMQPIAADQNGIHKFATINDMSIAGTDKSIQEFAVVRHLSAVDLQKLSEGIGPGTSFSDIIRNARELGDDCDDTHNVLDRLEKQSADITGFIERKNPGLQQGSWRPIYSSHDFK